jgi:hypothetical protein
VTIETLGTAGGLFAFLTFVHFFVDWGLQTHSEAMHKSTSWLWRARHCAIYTVGFVPAMLLMGFTTWDFVIGMAVLFLSHFVEDSYAPVYLWAKHIRRIPSVREEGVPAFKRSFGQPLGIVLFIGIDQIIHLLFLWVLVYLGMT